MLRPTSRLTPNQIARLAVACAMAYGIKGASSDFLPARDADLDAFAINFNALIQINPTQYGLDASAAAALAPLTTTFTADLAAATNPLTKTKVTVASKDAAKAALKAFIRSLAKIVQATASVSNADKEALGLPIHNNAPSPIPPPTTWPNMALTPQGPLILSLEYSDSATPTSRRKPTGAIALVLYGVQSSTPITDPTLIPFIDIFTKSPQVLSVGAANGGKTMYFVGRWVTRTGLLGPYGPITPAGVAA